MNANGKDTNPLLTHRLEAERSLIGTAFIAQAETRQACGWLKPEAFYLEQCGKFWQRFTAGEDAYTVALDLGMLADASAWGNDLPSAMYGTEYARQVAEGAYMEQAHRLTVELAQATIRADIARTKELQAQLAAIAPHAHQGAHNWFDVACHFIEALDANVRSIGTGIGVLDKAIAGFERQTESVIAARPSQGKSTLGLQIAMHAASNKQRVLFVSLEMSETNLFARAACPLVGTTWLDVRRGVVSDAVIDSLRSAAADLGMLYAPHLYVYDKRATTETIWELAQAHNADLVFVDHLRKVADNPDMPEVKRLGLITSRMKQMAKELNLHTCLLVQLNRGADADVNTPPELKHLRDSGEIEEDADLVMMLHGLTPTLQDKQDNTRNTDLWIRKARDGVKDARVKLRYSLRSQQFEGRANEKGEPE